MTSTEYTAVLLLSSLSCLTTILGVVLALWLQRNDQAVATGIGFSAGIMCLISLVELTLKCRRFLFGAALLSALAEPFGALLGLLAIEMAPVLSPYFLSFAGGAMIFVSVHELVPLARLYGSPWYYTGGIALSMVVYRLLALVVTGVDI